MALEKHIENKVVEWAKKRGFLTPKVRFVDDGYPDRLFISPAGHTIFLEFKQPGKGPTPLQAYRLNELRRRGVPAYWTDNELEGKSILGAALEPEAVSGESNTDAPGTGGGRVVSGPWTGENEHNPSDVQDPQSEGSGEQDAAGGSSEAGLQGLAGRDPEVG